MALVTGADPNPWIGPVFDGGVHVTLFAMELERAAEDCEIPFK